MDNDLYIKIKDGVPFEHPIYEWNLKMVYPDFDPNNLPKDFVKFIRLSPPIVGLFDVVEGPTYELKDNICQDFYTIRPMTDEERKAKINEFKGEPPLPSWVFDENSLTWLPPVAMPTDGKEYAWDERTKSWHAIVIDEADPPIVKNEPPTGGDTVPLPPGSETDYTWDKVNHIWNKSETPPVLDIKTFEPITPSPETASAPPEPEPAPILPEPEPVPETPLSVGPSIPPPEPLPSEPLISKPSLSALGIPDGTQSNVISSSGSYVDTQNYITPTIPYPNDGQDYYWSLTNNVWVVDNDPTKWPNPYCYAPGRLYDEKTSTYQFPVPNPYLGKMSHFDPHTQLYVLDLNYPLFPNNQVIDENTGKPRSLTGGFDLYDFYENAPKLPVAHEFENYIYDSGNGTYHKLTTDFKTAIEQHAGDTLIPNLKFMNSQLYKLDTTSNTWIFCSNITT